MLNKRLLTFLTITVIILLASGCADKKNNQPMNPHQSARVDWTIVQLIEAVSSDISRASGARFELRLMADQTPNAYALKNKGDNYIILTLGLLDIVDKDADEYAFVIAHEMVHLCQNHIRAKEKREAALDKTGGMIISGLEIIGMGLGVPVGLVSSLAVESGTGLASLKYSRDQEREADRLGVQFMKKAGYDPNGAITFQKKLISLGDDDPLPIFSTHPPGQERLAELRAFIGQISGE